MWILIVAICISIFGLLEMIAHKVGLKCLGRHAINMLQESGTRVISVFRCEKKVTSGTGLKTKKLHDPTYEVKNNNKQKNIYCN